MQAIILDYCSANGIQHTYTHTHKYRHILHHAELPDNINELKKHIVKYTRAHALHFITNEKLDIIVPEEFGECPPTSYIITGNSE